MQWPPTKPGEYLWKFHLVSAAADTKWNFHKYSPGLVGGHCIGVDPYYLVHKAEDIGYKPEIILAGRNVNDGMSEFVALELIKLNQF